MEISKKEFWSKHSFKFGIGAAITYWLIESFNDSFLKVVMSYSQALFYPPWSEAWTRVLVSVFFVVISFFAQRLLRKLIIAEEEIKRNLDQTELFAYSVMHDLKNPSISIYGFAKLLHDHYETELDAKGNGYCGRIMDAAKQVVELVETVNRFISSKKTSLQLEEIRLKEIFETIGDEFSTILDLSKIKLIIPECTAKIKADRISLVRVIRNLVDNSIKHGGDGMREIKINYQETEMYHLLSVQNDGRRIRSGLEKLFQPFERGQADKSVKGSGLGLAIIKEIAEKHKGKVWAESSAKEGTTFFIALSKYL